MSDRIASTIHNEQVKLGASLLNTLAAAFVVTGVIVPVVAYLYGSSTPRGQFWIIYIVLWVGLAMAFHRMARKYLRRMQP